MHALIQEFSSIVHSIGKEDIVAIFHDKDPDGITSGVIVAKTIERIRGFPPEHSIVQSDRSDPLSPSFIDLLQKNNVSILITTDTSLDKYEQQLQIIAAFARIIIFDHHKIYSHISHPDILLIKSQFIAPSLDPSQYCTAKLTYDVCSTLTSIDDLDWIASIGILADSNYKTYQEFVDTALIKNQIPLSKEIFTTKLGRIATLIGYADAMSTDMNEVFEKVYNASTYSDLLNSLKEYDVVGKELNEYILGREGAEQYLDCIIYDISPTYKFGSMLSTVLSFKYYADKTVILISDFHDGVIHISARRQDGTKAMNTLLENSIIGLTNANAGGHVPAAGATIQTSDKEQFLKQLKQIYVRVSK